MHDEVSGKECKFVHCIKYLLKMMSLTLKFSVNYNDQLVSRCCWSCNEDAVNVSIPTTLVDIEGDWKFCEVFNHDLVNLANKLKAVIEGGPKYYDIQWKSKTLFVFL